MGYRSGATSQVVIGKQNTINTMPTTPVGHLLRKASFTFDGIKELIEDDTLRSDPNPSPDATGLQKVNNAQLVVPVTADEFGLLAYFFFGSYAVTGAGPYEHVYKVSATDPSPIWVEVGDTSETQYDLFEGLYISSISLGAITKESSQWLKATVNFVGTGKYTLNGSSPQDASPDAHTDLKHTMPLTTVNVDGSATAVITEISHTMSRTINTSGVLDGTIYHSDADLQKYMFDCTIKGWRDGSDTIFGYDDDAEHTVEIISPRPGAPTRSVEILHPEAYIFNSEGSGGVSGDGPVMAVARVRPFYVNAAAASSIVVTVNSDVASYATATAAT